jgi:hypothetical protein
VKNVFIVSHSPLEKKECISFALSKIWGHLNINTLLHDFFFRMTPKIGDSITILK